MKRAGRRWTVLVGVGLAVLAWLCPTVSSAQERARVELQLGYGITRLKLTDSEFSTRGMGDDQRMVSFKASGSDLGLIRPVLHTIEFNLGVASSRPRSGPALFMPMAFHWGSVDAPVSSQNAWAGPGSTVYGFSMGLGPGFIGYEGPVTLRGTAAIGFRVLALPMSHIYQVDNGATDTAALLRGFLEPRLGVDFSLGPSAGLGAYAGFDVFHPGEYTYGAFFVIHTDPSPKR